MDVSDLYPGNINAALKTALAWLISRMNSNDSGFNGLATVTPTVAATFCEGALDDLVSTYDEITQQAVENVALNPLHVSSAGVVTDLDKTKGPDGFLINSVPLGGAAAPTNPFIGLINVFGTENPYPVTISGVVLNMSNANTSYRVDVYSTSDALYYQGSATPATDGTWSLAGVHTGTVIAILMDSGTLQPAAGSHTSGVTGWIAHSNMGVGKKLKNYFIRINSKTDIEYLVEDQLPIIIQDSIHARFGTSKPVSAGTLVAHLVYNDPVLGEIDLYSTLQNLAIYSDLPRSIQVPPGDPDYEPASDLTGYWPAPIQNRSWIYDAALMIIVFSIAGLWDLARRIIVQLNVARANQGYLPSRILEDAQDGLTSRWTPSGGMTISNIFDSTEPPAPSGGSQVIQFTSTGASSAQYSGAGFPDSTDNMVSWRYKTSAQFSFAIGVTSSTGKVTSIIFASTGTPGYNSTAKTITVNLPVTGLWQAQTENLQTVITEYVPGELFQSMTSFAVGPNAVGSLNLDNLSVGKPQPAGSLSFSYDVWNGQVDQAYIRAGAIAWVAYAYAIYMERTKDYANTWLGLQALVNFLFTLQSTAADLTNNLFTLGYGKYQDPGYQYVPGQLFSVSTEHNIDCYNAFLEAAKALPVAAATLLAQSKITGAQHDSIILTSQNCASKAAQISAALLANLWIPAAGGVKGHFAQGASSSGLDTSYALDASGYLAAVFAHNAGDDTKAVSCLEFIFENFWLTNQQILLNTTVGSPAFNSAYQQLTPFDGFQTYADSAGGYSGSPHSIWAEGTWGAIGAFLTLQANATLTSYFAGTSFGSLTAFLKDACKSMATMYNTTTDGGLVAYQLANRPLPWEFSVFEMIGGTAMFWLTANAFYGGAGVMRPYLKIPQGVQQSVRQLEGQSSIGALELEVVDVQGYASSLVSGGKLEGRKASLAVGYPGMNTTDFVTVATQRINEVDVLSDATGFKLICADLKRSAKTKIFLTGDDGQPVSHDHVRTLVANPMDVALMVLQNELGVGQSDLLPQSAWRIYDPKQWSSDLTSNPTLINPNPLVDVDTFLSYRNDIFAGFLFDFYMEETSEAKQFLEYEVFKALGGYWITLADGRVSPRFFYPPYSLAALARLDQTNIVGIPTVTRSPIINQVTVRMDYHKSQRKSKYTGIYPAQSPGYDFETELNFAYAPSLQQFDLQGIQIIESKGMTMERGGIIIAELTASAIFKRYGGIDPVTGNARAGAPIYEVTSQFMTLGIEAGDFVFLSHPLLPDFETGQRGLYGRICEVTDKQPDYARGRMKYKLLDTGWMAGKVLSEIAPSAAPGIPTWPNAGAAQRAQFMFLCSSVNDEYSDGNAGKTIW